MTVLKTRVCLSAAVERHIDDGGSEADLGTNSAVMALADSINMMEEQLQDTLQSSGDDTTGTVYG